MFRSVIAASLIGSIGGCTYTKSVSGRVVRGKRATRYTPTRVSSQAASQFGMVSSIWRTLTDSQRESWYEAAEGNGGFQLFKKRNANRLLAGMPVLLEPAPVPELMDFTTTFDIFSDFPGLFVMQVSVISDVDLDRYVAYVMATGPVSRGVGNVAASRYRFVGSGQNIAGGPIVFEVQDSWQSRYGNLAGYEQEIVYMKLKLIDKVSGYAYQIVRDSDIIQP